MSEEAADPNAYKPLVQLENVDTVTGEEGEETVFSIWDEEWKERGVGDCKILKHTETKKSRVLMRRDKTLKICANHLCLPQIELKVNPSSDRAWVYITPADFSDGEPKMETLAIRFKDKTSIRDAGLFKDAFEKAQKEMEELKEQADAAEDAKEEGEKNVEEAEKEEEKVEKKVEEKPEEKVEESKPAEEEKKEEPVSEEKEETKAE